MAGHLFRGASALAISAAASVASAQTVPPAADPAGTPSEAQATGSPPVASAQAADSNQPGVGDIVVTAQKRSERLNDVPISINAVSGPALTERGVLTTADLGKTVAGFSYQRSSFGAPVYQLRGVGFYDTGLSGAPTVSIYNDEVPLPFPTEARGAVFDLERVEVLKGPQGTLFGQNSTGGAINYIAAKPTRDLHAGIDLDYGSYDRVRAGAFVSGPITDTLRVRVALQHEYGGGWQKSLTRRGDRLGDADMTIGRFLADWTPTDRLTVNLILNGWVDRGENQAAQLRGFVGDPATFPRFAVSPLAPSNPRAADWGPETNLRRHDDFGQAALKLNYELGGGISVTSITAYDQFKRTHSYLDNDGSAVQDLFVNTRGNLRTFNQELRLQGSAAANSIKWVVGGNYQRDKTDDYLFTYSRDGSFFPAFQTSGVQNLQRVRTYAGFANVDWTFADRLTLHGGVRYTEQKRRFGGCALDTGDGIFANSIAALATALSGRPTTIPAGGCVTLDDNFQPTFVRANLNQSNVSWRGALDWKVTNDKLLYASVSKGYKSGSFPTLTAVLIGTLTPARQESLVSYEAGFKFGFFRRTLQVNGAAFYYDYSNKQVVGRISAPVGPPLFGLINIPKSRIYGGELQVEWQPSAALRISANGSYTSSRILDNFTNVNVLAQPANLGGESFPITPKWQGNIDAQYEVPIGAAKAFVGAAGRYQSKTNGALGELPAFAIKSYATLDLRAGIRLADPGLTLTVYAENVTNTYSWNSTVLILDGIERYANPPRIVGVRLGYRY